MKYIFTFLAAMIFISVSHPAGAQTKLSVVQFDSLITKDKTVQLIDVRTPAEVATGVIKGSKNINYSGEDFLVKMGALDKSKPVAVYCAVGGRSSRSAIKLKEMGFARVYELTGGMTEWDALHMPTVMPADQ